MLRVKIHMGRYDALHNRDRNNYCIAQKLSRRTWRHRGHNRKLGCCFGSEEAKTEFMKAPEANLDKGRRPTTLTNCTGPRFIGGAFERPLGKGTGCSAR
jgi:hypothetical protein